MTLLEKATEQGYGYTEIINHKCPSELGLEESLGGCDLDCVKCWGREMPNTETKEEIFDYADGYDKGLNDAWELANTICGFTQEERYETFGNYTMEGVFANMTPQEALAKLKAYEEAQKKIEIGDIVKSTIYVDMKCGVVANITDDKASLVHKDGKFSIMVPIEFLVKTGKHIDIKSILESIGE